MKKIDYYRAKRLTSNRIPPKAKRNYISEKKLSPIKIIEYTCENLHVFSRYWHKCRRINVNEFFDSSRMRELVIARQVAVALMSEVMDMKAPEIKLYVSKDRTSIIHMLKEHNNAIDTSACYRSYYAQLLERITEIN